MQHFTRSIVIVVVAPLLAIAISGCQNGSEIAGTIVTMTADQPQGQANVTKAVVTSSDLLEERVELDKTVWAKEVEAQEYETTFVGLWDRVREAGTGSKLDVLANFPFEGELTFGTQRSSEELDAGITLTKYEDAPSRSLNTEAWKQFVDSLKSMGFAIIQTEWHHSRFVPGSDSSAPSSTISFAIHVVQLKSRTTTAVSGNLDVQWTGNSAGGTPTVDSIAVKGLTLQQRSKGGLFTKILTAKRAPTELVSAYPVLMYDLNHDGLSEIILPRWNRVYWNRGQRKFDADKFLAHPIPIWEAGVLSDFNGDGNTDFVTVGNDGAPYFYAGNEQGEFLDKPEICAEVLFDMPTAVTAGDADGDGDLDLWITQYKLSFTGGQMPTPFYDANDGHPSYYLENDGTGSFVDATDRAGLSPLRHRRTYSASFVDLDDDGDLDLLNVSDYAGLDIYRNAGKGKFKLDTESFVKEHDFFGMGHTIGDYNDDGLIDFYVIGMSSTTARRLDRLKLGREDRPDVHPMRKSMGYGNRLYLSNGDGTFREDPDIAKAVARTGWSWGTTSFDFDLDGDLDIYVANGHRSGKSCQDYCSTFWRHDIYTGDSKERPEVLKIFQSTLVDLNKDEISWNGYEKNVLFVNHDDKPERFINSSFMFGSAYAFDARSVISDDLDRDGWPDLVVAQSEWDGRGFPLKIHVFANDIKTGEPNHWVTIRLRESAGPGYSPNGAKVVVTDDLGRVQTRWIVSGDSFLAQHAPMAHFGLGKATKVTSIEVTWPNGLKRKHAGEFDVDSTYTLRASDIERNRLK